MNYNASDESQRKGKRQVMTIRKAKTLFESLRYDILADGVVDWAEIDQLLEFITTYVESGVKPFVGFNEVLMNCRLDGKITPEESKILIEWINKAYDYLDREDRVNQALCFVVKATLAGWLAWLAYKVVLLLI